MAGGWDGLDLYADEPDGGEFQLSQEKKRHLNAKDAKNEDAKSAK
jgi:hypothetical protein